MVSQTIILNRLLLKCLLWLTCAIYLSHFVHNCENGRKNYGSQFDNRTYGIIVNTEKDASYCEWLVSIGEHHHNLKYINLNIAVYNFNCHSDILYIFDGQSYEDKLIYSFSNNNSLFSKPLVSTSGHLLILHYSKKSLYLSNFVANYSITECPLNCSNHGTCLNHTCVCDEFWSGDACLIELCPNKCSFNGQCKQTSQSACTTSISSKHFCDCIDDYFGQSCDIVKHSYADHKDLLKWKIVSNNEKVFSARASQASVYDEKTDTIYSYGGRNFENVLGDLLTFSISNNKWHNLTDCNSNISSLIYPSSLWGHSLNVFDFSLILFGGIFSNGSFSNELWTYNLKRHQWRLHSSDLVIPALAFHTVTLADSEWLYIIGGRFQNGSHSGNIYRINIANGIGKWEIYNPINRRLSHDRQLIGHTAEYYKPFRSIIIFGGISLANGQSNQPNNNIHLYNINRRIWSTLDFSNEKDVHIPCGRAFHSMLIWNNYLLVFAGYTQQKCNNRLEKSCSDSNLYIYSLTCNRWIDFDLFMLSLSHITTKFPVDGLFSHSFVRRDNLLFVLGGYHDNVYSEIRAITLPKVLFDESEIDLCLQIRSKSACNLVPFCLWCPLVDQFTTIKTSNVSYCAHHESSHCPSNPIERQISNCPGICPRANNCYDCLSFHSTSNDLPFNHGPCLWDALQSRCVHNSIIQSPSSPLYSSDYEQCQHPVSVESGVTLLKYYHPPNLSYPDEVSILSQSKFETSFFDEFTKVVMLNITDDLSDSSHIVDNAQVDQPALVNIVRILGYIHPFGMQPYNENFIRLYLRMTSPKPQLLINRNPKELEKISSNGSFYNFYLNLPVNFSKEFIENNFLVDLIVTFPIKTTSSKLEYEKIQISWNESIEFGKIIQDNRRLDIVRALSPYHNKSECSILSNCLTCLSNTACVWSAQSQCMFRSNIYKLDHSLLIVDPLDCPHCSDYIQCDQCVFSQTCEWLLQNAVCVRKGISEHSIRNITLCPSECNRRTSCESCLDETNYCRWCESSQMCILSSTLPLSIETFDYCRKFNHKIMNYSTVYNVTSAQCNQCFRHSICQNCQNDPNCDWIWLASLKANGFCWSKSVTNLNETYQVGTSLIYSNGTCPEIDECKLGIHDCDPNSVCIDTKQSFKCLCKIGYTGDGRTCTRTCINQCSHGHCSESANFNCVCDLGWTGPNCDIDCNCNYHSTCENGVKICTECQNNTNGEHCEFCNIGSFGNATTLKGCNLCDCNGHGDETRGYCHTKTGVCFCKDNTEGTYCERCVSGFYGNPRNGRPCFYECQHRSFISDLDFGYFGSYMQGVHFSKHNHDLFYRNFYSNVNVNCLWILTSYSTPKKFHSFSAYFDAVVKKGRPVPISLNIFKSMKLNCTLSSVVVYDGLPRFISASNLTEATTLANLCGSNFESHINLVALSGFATVLYISDDLYQGFNASFQRLIKTEQKTIKLTNDLVHLSKESKNRLLLEINSFNNSFYKQTIWNVDSISNNNNNPNKDYWPKVFHTIEYFENCLLFVGGNLESYNLSITTYNLTSNQWQFAKNTPKPVAPINRIFHASALIHNSIFIYGGLNHLSNDVLGDLWRCQIDNNNNSLQLEWSHIETDNSLHIPPLLGHSFTPVRLNSEDVIVLIGGYSPEYGFLENRFIFSVSSNRWRMLHTNGAAPIGIFGHSTVHHPSTNSLYLFGGIDFKESQRTSISNSLYILNLGSKVWRRMQPTNVNDRNFPLSRYLHMAISTENYMVIIGGRLSHRNYKGNISAFAYSYRCNSWVSLNNRTFWSPTFPVDMTSEILSTSVVKGDRFYIYEAKLASSTNLIVGKSLSSLRFPADLCQLYSNDQSACLRITGCSFCFVQKKQNTSIDIQSYCFDSHINKPGQCSLGVIKDDKVFNVNVTNGLQCLSETVLDCSRYTNCVDCTTKNYELSVSEENGCQWCTDCRYKEGRCLKLNDTCDSFDYNLTFGDNILCPNISTEDTHMCPLQKCLATDCDKCLKYSKLNRNSLTNCVWTRQVYKFIQFGHTINVNPIFDWACIETSIIEATLHLPQVETIPPLSCPVRCHRHKTCALCLDGAIGDESGSHECVWSEMTHECMSPTYALIRCEQGLCGGHFYRKSHSQCPVNCEIYQKASDCLSTTYCGWCALNGLRVDGVGFCQKGGLFSPFGEQCNINNSNLLLATINNQSFYGPITNLTTEWHYLYLPRENECQNNHHSCDPKSQNCIDLEDGFMCRCKPGYKLMESFCKPICHQGCIFGMCVAPDVCRCNFGYIGEDCSLECQCHGHSTCPSANQLNQCVECHNNTLGKHCDLCKPLYVGDPKNGGTCQSCTEYCNQHSNLCFNEDVLNSSFAFDLEEESYLANMGENMNEGSTTGAICVNCKNNTEGPRCDRCKLGYFKISNDIGDGCRKCMCNGHGSICSPFNGENCDCHNNTENDRQCNYLNSKEYSNYINKTYFFKSAQIMTTYSLPCWMLQCSKCKDYFFGSPVNGHQCFRHMHIDKEYCFDPSSQDECLRKPRPLLHGRTVLFGIQPRYMNVDIRVVIYIIKGNVDLYLSSKDDIFVVKMNESSGLHHTFVDHNYVQQEDLNISLYPNDQPTYFNSTYYDNENYYSSYQHQIDTLSNLEDFALKPPFRLQQEDLNLKFPYYYTMNNLNEVVLLRNVSERIEITIPYKTHDLRTTRYFIMLRGNMPGDNGTFLSSTFGYILFRQDQCRIDLFVFFSVFFSCFFLFLCLSVALWKTKHIIDNRRAQQLHEIELENMASRPFGTVFILFENYKQFGSIDHTAGFRKMSPQSLPYTPAKKLSLFRQLTLGFKDSPKIYPENIQPASKSCETLPHDNKRPVSIELTADGLAAILTTFVQFPGGRFGQVQFASASSLISLKLSPQLYQQMNLLK